MVDILKDFEPFLKNWCHENHLPMPAKDNMNKVWQKAWQAYMGSYLKDNYEEVKQQYLNMPLLTKKELKRQLLEEEQNKLKNIHNEEELSGWQRVEYLMNQ